MLTIRRWTQGHRTVRRFAGTMDEFMDWWAMVGIAEKVKE